MSIIIKSKAKVMGDCLTTLELLDALKYPTLIVGSRIILSTPHGIAPLRRVYLCPHCNAVHFSCGDMDEETTALLHSSRVVLLDEKNPKGVTREQLIQLLESFNEVKHVCLEYTNGEGAYTLTRVYKCSPECQSIHLDCFYEDSGLTLN